MAAQYISKPQPTLVGFSSWAFDRLVERKGQSAATVAAQIVDDYLDSSRAELESLWGIRFEDWLQTLEDEKEIQKRLDARQAEEQAREERIEKEVEARLAKRGPRKIAG